MATLFVTRGLPGCGKSTRARAWVAENRAHRARVNRDDLRRMVDDGVFEKGVTERRIQVARDAAIRGLLKRGQDVVCDDTNLPLRTVRDLRKIARTVGADFEVWDMTDVPLDVCIERDAQRCVALGDEKNPVGEDVIRDMYTRFIKGRQYPLDVPEEPAEALSDIEPYVPVVGTIQAILVDLDGTAAHMGTRDPFDETRVHEDVPDPVVVELVQMYKDAGYWIVFCSGRTVGCHEATSEWLERHVMDGGWNYELFMRPVGDSRPDFKTKLDLFNQHIRHNFNVRLVLDDRDQVVQLWRALGLKCFQVAEGNF